MWRWTVLLIGAAAASVAAEEGSPLGPITAIELEIVVTGADGRPVVDLRPDEVDVVRPRVVRGLSALEEALVPILDGEPDGDLRCPAAVLHFDWGPNGLKHLLTAEVPLSRLRFVGLLARVQILARIKGPEGRPLHLRAELLRDGSKVAELPTVLPKPEATGEIRWAAKMGTSELPVGRWQLELLAQQGDTSAAGRAAFEIVDRLEDGPPVRLGP